MKLAIVGSVSLAGSPRAMAAVDEILDRYKPTLVVSGGAIGVDTMAVARAAERRIKTKIFLPKVARWHDGFKPRNIQIAEACDALVRIYDPASKTYGSGWTRDYARKLGKPTEEIAIRGEASGVRNGEA